MVDPDHNILVPSSDGHVRLGILDIADGPAGLGDDNASLIEGHADRHRKYRQKNFSHKSGEFPGSRARSPTDIRVIII